MAAFTQTFTTNNFTSDTTTGKVKMVITAETLDLGGGMNIRLSKLLRQDSGKYANAIAAYEVDLSGNMTIYSDEPFNGKLVITSDE